MINSLTDIGIKAKKASRVLAIASTEQKNKILNSIAKKLSDSGSTISLSNESDIKRAKESNASSATIDRLRLTSPVIESMIEGIKTVLAQPDPVGEVFSEQEIQPGLYAKKVSVPIGVVGIIYEGRPNVTVDAAALAIKSGNTIILRGSSTAFESNKALVAVIQEALMENDCDPHCVQLIEDTSREGVLEFLKLRDFVDVMIPRGGADLIQFVVNNSTVPVIETGAGVCHIYIEADADIDMAKKVLLNGKTQRPSVCNALETLLLSKDLSLQNQKLLLHSLLDAGVTCYGCANTRQLDDRILNATEESWSTEYQNLSMSVKVVHGVSEAIEHILQYGTKHSECIITKNNDIAAQFQSQVDAAAVYHNASTRFTDGFQFGFGAELGISTQKLHARGPMGLKELTSYKYLLKGQGNCRC